MASNTQNNTEKPMPLSKEPRTMDKASVLREMASNTQNNTEKPMPLSKEPRTMDKASVLRGAFRYLIWSHTTRLKVLDKGHYMVVFASEDNRGKVFTAAPFQLSMSRYPRGPQTMTLTTSREVREPQKKGSTGWRRSPSPKVDDENPYSALGEEDMEPEENQKDKGNQRAGFHLNMTAKETSQRGFRELEAKENILEGMDVSVLQKRGLGEDLDRQALNTSSPKLSERAGKRLHGQKKHRAEITAGEQQEVSEEDNEEVVFISTQAERTPISGKRWSEGKEATPTHTCTETTPIGQRSHGAETT
ncbi:hypothetical protein R1sor_008885 [Riccia sorocarpa]|uniref:Uncharacterized protein n=1 Tax=Riccia sorocarpa TaxID=122646 RepID=A0ABD3H696_9MARC